MIWKPGPGLIVTAAFIGPGTVVTASRAGLATGYQLLWVVVFSIVATGVLQAFAARLGIHRGCGLARHIHDSARNKWWKWPITVLVVAAIGFGNAAYQTGNLSGASLGLQSLCGGSMAAWITAVSLFAGGLLLVGEQTLIKRTLVVMVVVMSSCFVLACCLAQPDLSAVVAGLWPRVPDGEINLALALVGTTVVPYNLFLHSSTSAKQWKNEVNKVAIRQATADTWLSIVIGGLITASILVAVAAIPADETNSTLLVEQIIARLEEVLGGLGPIVFGCGLFAAGLTSAVTAPLAAAYAVTGILGRAEDESGWSFRLISAIVLAFGAASGIAFSRSPAQTIVLAQVANGLLLPVSAGILLWSSRRNLKQRDWLLSFAGWVVFLLVTALAIYRLSSLL